MKFSRLNSLLFLALGASAVHAAVVGDYRFDGDLTSVTAGQPTLSQVGPAPASPYGTASLYGATRTTYSTLGGSAGAGHNEGLLYDGTGLTSAYTVELVLKFDGTSGWRKLVDTSSRNDDRGWYISPSSQLDIFPTAGGSTLNAGDWHYIVFSFDGTSSVKGYLDGALAFTGSTTSAASLDASHTLNLFVDDNATSDNEYTTVTTALVRVNNSLLSDGDVATLAVNPFTSSVPEPCSLIALGLGAAALLKRRKK